MPAAGLDIRPVTELSSALIVIGMSEFVRANEWERASEPFGVLLVRKAGFIDGTFEYVGDRLPEVDEEIEVTRSGATPLRAKVTSLEKAKSRPIRAVEL